MTLALITQPCRAIQHSVRFHNYADDMQFFICKPARATNPKTPFHFSFSRCYKMITIWKYEKILVIDVHSNKKKIKFLTWKGQGPMSQ